MSKIETHRLARLELVHAYILVDTERPGHGELLEEEFEALVRQILEHPDSGKKIEGYPPELNLQAFHFTRFKYALIVANGENGPEIFAVKHHRQRPGYWDDRL